MVQKFMVEKSGIEMSFNLLNALTLTPKNKRKLLCFFYWLYSQSAGLFRHTRKLGNPIETRLGLGSYSRRRHIGIVSAHENHHQQPIEYIEQSDVKKVFGNNQYLFKIQKIFWLDKWEKNVGCSLTLFFMYMLENALMSLSSY